jgi:HEPN domain-containing protein
MMADGDEPKRILQQAAGFYMVEQLLMAKEPANRNEAVGLAMTTCLLQAFTSELMLKCLIRIEGGSPRRIHDLLELFNLLSAPTRERLEAMWTDYVQRYPDQAEAFKQVRVTLEPELTSALAAGRNAFELIRYWHEDPDEEYVFYHGPSPRMLFLVAFDLRPDWAEPK